MFNESEYLRYARHFSLYNVGIAGQQKLKAAKVLCVGCGGLASSAIMYLAAAGIGTLGIIDSDTVDESNLQRQIQFITSDIGAKKVVATKKRITELNPNVNVLLYDTNLNEINALEIINEFDVVIDCTDNFYSKYLINDACFTLGKPFAYASVFQFEGQASFFDGKNSPCFRCLFISPPSSEMSPNCAEEGVLGVVPGLMGTLEAIETIKWIIGLGDNLLGRLLFFDTLRMVSTSLKFTKSKICPLCNAKKSFSELTRPNTKTCDFENLPSISAQELNNILSDVVLVDVREVYEQQICSIGGVSVPLKEFNSAISSFDKEKPIVVYCKSGKRSQDAVKLLLSAGFSKALFLNGGILSWIDQINPSLKRY